MIQPDPDGLLFFIEIHRIAWPHEGWKTRSCHASAFNKLFRSTMEWSYDYSPDWNFSIWIPGYPWKRVWYCPGTAIWQPYLYPSIPLSILLQCYLHLCHALSTFLHIRADPLVHHIVLQGGWYEHEQDGLFHELPFLEVTKKMQCHYIQEQL